MFELKHSVVDIAVVCSDFEKSLEFYRDRLGMDVALDITIPDSTAQGACLAPTGFRQVRLKLGETLIKLVESKDKLEPRTTEFQAGVRWLTVIVKDVPEAVAALSKKGVRFLSEPVAAPDAAYVVCAEAPDGILIEFVQLLDS